MLEGLLAELYGPGSRSGPAARRIASIEALGMPATRSGGEAEDSLFYLVNFDDSMGFALLAADTRIEIPVFALTEKGNLSGKAFGEAGDDFYSSENIEFLSDTVNEHPFLGMANYEEFFEKILVPGLRIVNPGTPRNKSDTLFKKYEPGLGIVTYEFINKRGPYLRTLWCQDAPFNDFCLLRGGTRTPAGCTPVMVAQIFNYFRHPGGYDGLDFHWNEVNRIYNIDYGNTMDFPRYILDYAADDLLKIGRACKAEYTAGGTHVNFRNAKRFMDKRGYSGTRFQTTHLLKKTKEMINSGKPVPIRAERKDKYGNIKGHAWVIDGYATRKKLIDGKPQEYRHNLVHCNFGWQGRGNGYYAIELFDVENPIHPDFDSDEENKTDDPYIYYRQFKIITYYKP